MLVAGYSALATLVIPGFVAGSPRCVVVFSGLHQLSLWVLGASVLLGVRPWRYLRGVVEAPHRVVEHTDHPLVLGARTDLAALLRALDAPAVPEAVRVDLRSTVAALTIVESMTLFPVLLACRGSVERVPVESSSESSTGSAPTELAPDEGSGSGTESLSSEDAEVLAQLRDWFACAVPAPPVIVTRSRKVRSLDDLCDAFRDQPEVGCHQVGCEWAARECTRLWALRVHPPMLESARLAGLGVPVSTWTSSSPPSSEEIAAVGAHPKDLEMWLGVARQHSVHRIERWPAVISDPYHGQPGLVVRTDIGFDRGDHWLVCKGEDSPLLYDNSVIPPDSLECTPSGAGPRWRTCRLPGGTRPQESGASPP